MLLSDGARRKTSLTLGRRRVGGRAWKAGERAEKNRRPGIRTQAFVPAVSAVEGRSQLALSSHSCRRLRIFSEGVDMPRSNVFR